MTGCIDSTVPATCRELDATIESVLPAVEDLLQRLSGEDQVVCLETEGTDIKLRAPLRFPDGIGQGQVVANLFRWREAVRLDVEIVHNRMLARPDGIASDRRCFLNDYQASVTLEQGATELPSEFRREVISGVSAAQQAVLRHNRSHPEPWGRVAVTVSSN
ncbi:MAG: hypothetical protein ACE5HT_09750 [Gemmatimonadales bacterium]